MCVKGGEEGMRRLMREGRVVRVGWKGRGGMMGGRRLVWDDRGWGEMRWKGRD